MAENDEAGKEKEKPAVKSEGITEEKAKEIEEAGK